MTRLDRVRTALGDAGVEALLVTDLPSVRWLTGFTGSAGVALVRCTGPVLLATDDRYTLRARAEAPEAELMIERGWEWLSGQVAAECTLGVEADVMPWATVEALRAALPGVELTATEGLIRAARSEKDEAEVSLLRQACDVTAAAFTDALGWLAPGMTEQDVDRRLDQRMRELGAEDRAFPSIIASGPNGAIPHHAPSTRQLAAGDLLTMDFGARVGGYHADMTRTVALGEPSPELRRIYKLVQAAQQAGVEAVADGVSTQAVDAACRQLIVDAGHGEDFRHGTGHGVGLEVHEEPYLGARTPGTLRARMTVTVEPGIYVPGLGGVRIEDVVLVGHDGGDRLTTASRELIIL